MGFIRLLQTLLSLSLLCLMGCDKQHDETLRIGVIQGPEYELIRCVEPLLSSQNIPMRLITFNDYRLPNMALADGDIDVNVFQHKPYLEYMLHQEPAPLVVVGKTFIYPMGLYSKTLDHLGALKAHSQVAIPNDPSNQARALQLLAQTGLITLQTNTQHLPTLHDIQSNPKALVIKPLDAANLPRMLDEIALAAINLNYALSAQLNPNDALALEDAQSDYANIIVTRQALTEDPRIRALIQALHDPTIVEKAKSLFSQHAIPAWHQP